MSNASVTFDLSGVLAETRILSRAILPRVREAIGAIAQTGKNDWADAVMKAPGIWSEEKKKYVDTIRWEYTGEFSARVWASYRYADEIDAGRPPRDLKLMLNTSMKVRTVQHGKNAGKRYLIIPLRHNTPGNSALAPAMPPSVYEAVKQLAPSRVTGMGSRVSGTGAWDTKTRAPATVPQRRYAWGGRLDASQVAGLSAEQMKRYQGMVRFDTKGKGAVGHSTHLTFRVMMEGSPGWITKPQPGQDFVGKVVDRLQPLGDQIIAKAVHLDLSGRR